jgi:NAD(P)-dependent dehydrogenase (short-subunit alcohol dehydrogenase family)
LSRSAGCNAEPREAQESSYQEGVENVTEKLFGKNALVTGAGSGIGREIAVSFAREGARVLCVDQNAESAAGTRDLIEAAGGTALAEVGDVANAEDVRRVVRGGVEALGAFDILVNNAGVGRLGTVVELDEATWDRVMAVNVKSVFLFSKEIVPGMAEKGSGAIINVASVSGLKASAGRAVYTTSKGAVVLLTRAMALDHAHEGIRVNAICPGVTVTPMTEKSLEDPPTLQQKLDDTPMGRLATPDEIAPMAVFLASDDASFMTGAAVTVDGGWTA